MNVYITKANANKIISQIDFRQAKINGTILRDIIEPFLANDEDVFFAALQPECIEDTLFDIFSKSERAQLLAYQGFMKNPKQFIREVYIKYPKKEDTYWWVYEKKNPPAYHQNSECPYLHSDFKNYRIPAAIRFKGIADKKKSVESIKDVDLTAEEKEKVKANVLNYRDWWEMEGGPLYEKDKNAFLNRVNLRFQPEPRILRIETFEQDNSGTQEIDNSSLKELLDKIDRLLADSWSYIRQNDKNSRILNKYKKCSGSNINSFQDNDTGFTDQEIKEVLDDYNKRFKRPLKILLKEVYRRYNNPDLTVDEELLMQLGFKRCAKCYGYMDTNELQPASRVLKDDYLEDIVDESDEAIEIMLEASEYHNDTFWNDILRTK